MDLVEGSGKESKEVEEAKRAKFDTAGDNGIKEDVVVTITEKIDVAEHSAFAAEIVDFSVKTIQRSDVKGKRKIERLYYAKTKKKTLVENYASSLVEKSKRMRNCSMHKVHSGLRDATTAKHYGPVLLSIGPYYHRNSSPLENMDRQKDHYLYLDMGGNYRKAVHSNCKKALENAGGIELAFDCYVDDRTKDYNGECMVRDGFFLIELFRRNLHPAEYDQDISENSGLLNMNISWVKPRLERDILLFENQIPLFILRALFALSEKKVEENTLVELALQFFEFNGKGIPNVNPTSDQMDMIPHLLGLVYHALVPDTDQTPQQPNKEWESCEFIRTAAALNEVGVEFFKAADDAAFYDIHFSGRVFSIPRLVIKDTTESFFRNLVAYEEYSEHYRLHRVSDYLRVMDSLINSPKDVELLRHCGIIDNRIGDDVKVSTLFNHLCSGLYFDQKKFFYAQMFDEVNKFCKDPWNMRWAKLKNDYFGSPWSGLSVAAAVILLVLTIIQTILSGLAYFKPRT